MDEINNFNVDNERSYAIPLTILAAVMLTLRIVTAPEPIQTVYTDSEASAVNAASEILSENPKFTTYEDIDAYTNFLGSTLNSESCSQDAVSFSSQADMWEYLTRQYELAEDIEGTGSCITFSGFPSSQLEVANGLLPALEKSVVKVEIGFSSGTGFVISEDLIFTNFHVIADDNDKPYENIEIKTLDGKTYKAKYAAGNYSTDVGILRTSTPITNASPVKFSDMPLAYGEPVLSIGHPQSLGDWRSTVGVYYGDMENLFEVTGPRFSLPNQSGSSGSPIFNLDGELVAAIYGINNIAESKSRTMEEARYQVPLHSPILSSYAISAGVSLDSISKFLAELETVEK